MDRIVRDLVPSRRTEDSRPRYFSEYSARANIVLLGDPGAGKSHLFRTFAGTEGGRYETVRTFLATPVRAQGKTLFIDALDERRAGRGDRDTVDALVGKLFEAAPAKVRLSCRHADWLGETDLSVLGSFFEQNGGKPVVLSLAALSQDERRAILSAKGLNSADSDAFLEEAEQRGLGDLLSNPENLTKLLEVVQSGRWPETYKELFELSTSLMLQEANSDRARAGTGVYSVKELRPVAGALFAARLISDVEAIGLFDQEGTETVPSYRSVSFLDREHARAALTRRVFVAGPVPESADYAHRTTAEYLGAAWLADAVRDGLPFARLQALMGVDGHPAPELRGLHAWLAVHLPQHAERVIDADPYGVLTYGDAASLSRSNCSHLLQALGRLSQADPRFRSRQSEADPRFRSGQSQAIGALSRADMVEEFRAVMRSHDEGFGIRSIVAEALALGAPQLALKDDLATVLVRTQSTYTERLFAFRALLRLGAAGKEALRNAYCNDLDDREDGLRLRIEILAALYGDPFGPADVVALIDDVWSAPDELPAGVLFSLADDLPLYDLPAVLDRVRHQGRSGEVTRPHAWEVGWFYERSLGRVWNEMAEINPARALNWLRECHAFGDDYGGDRSALHAALRAEPKRLAAVVDHFFETLDMGGSHWEDFYHFNEMVLYLIGPDETLGCLMRHLSKAEPGSAKQRFLYEAAIPFTWRGSSQHGRAVFEELYELGETDAALREIRNAKACATLPERYFEHRAGRQERDEKARNSRAQQREQFERDLKDIRSGRHLGWLGFLAKVYFGMFRDLDASQTPDQRLASVIGEANVPAAMEGLKAVLMRNDLPDLETVAALAAERRLYEWWYAIIVALEERFAVDGDFSAFSDQLLRAALAFNLACPVRETRENVTGRLVHTWKTAAVEQHPALVRDAYVAVARAQLAKGEQLVSGLREMMTEEAFAPFRAATVLEFLRSFPNAHIFRLNDMLGGVLVTPEAHAEFLELAGPVVAGTVAVDAPQGDRWLTTAYLLAPLQFENAFRTRAEAHPGLIFDLRDLSGSDHQPMPTMALALPQLESLARLTGTLYPYAGPPSGGWSGDTNAWDASDYFLGLVNTITTNPSETATTALARLEEEPALASYKTFLLDAKARQQARRRESEYDRPDWQSTINALDNGPPATVADLHALLVEHLDDVRTRIARTNTDRFKDFWNVDEYGRPTEQRPEEVCRDKLVEFLRTGLESLGVTVEPEGHMARDKRADVSVAMPGRKVLCEIKCDDHKDVWTAVENQLERFYVHDPEARGFGVYIVLWFGTKRRSLIPLPPNGQARPGSAAEMERLLRQQLPEDRSARIAIRVIDVSGEVPGSTKAKQARRGRKKKSGVKRRDTKTRA